MLRKNKPQKQSALIEKLALVIELVLPVPLVLVLLRKNYLASGSGDAPYNFASANESIAAFKISVLLFILTCALQGLVALMGAVVRKKQLTLWIISIFCSIAILNWGPHLSEFGNQRNFSLFQIWVLCMPSLIPALWLSSKQ